MKKSKIKIISSIFLITYVLFIMTLSNVFAAGGADLNGFDKNIYESVTAKDDDAGDIVEPVGRVLSTVVLILQICAVGGVVFMGVKYMYAASEDKAKIKQTLIWVVLGTILVFAAPTIINFISNSADRVI